MVVLLYITNDGVKDPFFKDLSELGKKYRKRITFTYTT